MSANQMQIQDVYAVLNTIHAQVTGNDTNQVVDTSTYVSVANTLMQNNTDAVYNALMNTIAKTIFSTRPYSRQFGGLIVDSLKWGAITRKIQFGDTDAYQDKAFHDIVDGQSVDHYIVNKGDVLETRYYGSAVYQDVMTVFRDQLVNAFSGPEQLGSFISAKANEVNNKWTQWTEDLSRGLVLNTIMSQNAFLMESGATPTIYDPVIRLRSLYNGETGASLQYEDLFAAETAKPFWEWVRAKIRTIQRNFTNRTHNYYLQISGHNIIRHTPYKNQKVYLLAPYMDLMETSTLSEAFHNDMLQYADYEAVSYWQDPSLPDQVRLSKYTFLNPSTGSYMDSTAEMPTSVNHILGVIFDEDMMNVNIRDTIIQNTPLNARGLYYNTWLSAHAAYGVDFTEKCCVLSLD